MCEQEDFWWPSCVQWGGRKVTPATMCQHTVPLCHCWPSPACATLPVRCGEVTVESLCASIYGDVSYQHIKPSDRTDLNFPQEHCQGCLSHLNTSETSNTKLLAAVTFIWQMQPFYWLFWEQWFFWWSASGLNLQKPVGLFLNRNYPKSNPRWPNPTAEPIEDRHSLKTTKPPSEKGFRVSKTKSLQPSLYEQHNFFH